MNDSHLPLTKASIGAWKFRPLLLSLLLLLVLYPYLEHRVLFLRCLSATVLLAGIYAVSRDRRVFIVACLLGIPTLGLEVANVISTNQSGELAARIGIVLFSGFTTSTILWHVFSEDNITSDTLYGAASAYLLSGHTWTTLYVLIEMLQPGSFYMNSEHNLDQVVNFSDLVLFSYATLTTLGYGDITPVTSPARSLAILEAVFGVLYTVILVARLIGLYQPGARPAAKA